MQGKTGVIVNSEEEEKALGEGWFDSPAKCPDREAEQAEIQRHYRERFEAAVGNPTEQVRIHIEYRSLHPNVAAADSWHLEMIPLIPILQSQAMLDLAAKRQAEDRERRAIEAEATEAPVVADPAPRIPSAGKRRDEGIEARDHLIATLKESYKSLKGIRRNKRIAQSLDEQKDMHPPGDWGVRTFVEATENPKIRPAFDRMVAKAQYKKIPTK